METTDQGTQEMGPSNAWRPLLEGELAFRAHRAIDAIASEVMASRRSAATLATGASGLALFLAYMSETRGLDGGGESRAEAYADKAMAYLNHATDSLRRGPLAPSLFSGFTGIGWVMEHLEGRLYQCEDDDEEQGELDDALGQVLRVSSRRWDYDLINGLAGWAIYSLEALPRPSARQSLELIAAKIEQLATNQAGKHTWFTPPELLTKPQLETHPNGYFNVGVAHGLAGLAGAMARIIASGIEPARLTPLLEDAVDWLLAQELPPDARSLFPSWVVAGDQPKESRLAWCYGDPGIAATLLATARFAERRDWEREALRIARQAAARTIEEDPGVRDAGLCHGTAGLAHLFNRLYQASGDVKIGAAARHWFERTLDKRRPGQGVGGFLSWSPDAQGNMAWRANEGFLTGASGIALALLAGLGGPPPDWDRVLLLATPSSLRCRVNSFRA